MTLFEINLKKKSLRNLLGATLLSSYLLAILLIYSLFTGNITFSPYTANATLSAENNSSDSDFVPGEAVVKFKSQALANELLQSKRGSVGNIIAVSSPRLTEILTFYNVDQVKQPFAKAKDISFHSVLQLRSSSLSKDADKTKLFIEALSKLPEVAYAEVNAVYQTNFTPNDTYFDSSGAWGQPFKDLWGVHKIEAPSAWDTTQGEGVVIAVSDTGIDYNHEDIRDNVWTNPGETGPDSLLRDKSSNGVDDDNNGHIDDWRGYDFSTYSTPSFWAPSLIPPTTKERDNDPIDDHSHGSHVSGTISAIGNNGKGITGVAPKAKIMALKGMNQQGKGAGTDMASTILYAADMQADVLNMSWGGVYTTVINEALQYAHSKDVILVAAAGNTSKEIGDKASGHFPGADQNVITVSAFNSNDQKADFSTFGQKIDIAAPGGGDNEPVNGSPKSSILSLLSAQAINQPEGNLRIGEVYTRKAGTSMAAPHVAGAAALLKAVHPDWNNEQIRQALRLGSDDILDGGFDIYSGYGRLNARKALLQTEPMIAWISDEIGPLNSKANRTVEIRGKAYGNNFKTWRLEYAPESSAADWTEITSSSTSVANGLLTSWNTSSLQDNKYVVRLTVENAQGIKYESRAKFTLDTTAPNLTITNPQDGSITPPGSAQTLSADFSDNMRVSKLEFYINNVFQCSRTTTPWSCAWNVPLNPPITTYEIKAVGYDVYGNVTTKTVHTYTTAVQTTPGTGQLDSLSR